MPSVPSPRGIWPAILQVMSETSNVLDLARSALAAIRRGQVASTPQASGVTIPMPVTTTRLIYGSSQATAARPAR